MPVPDDVRGIERHLLRDDAYDALRKAIVSGQFVPGEQLHDADLCKWLNLSRSPVRDALARLQDEGLVETAPQRFTRVTTIEECGVLECFPVLAAMHALAAELGVPALDRDAIAVLHAENRSFMEALAARDADRAYGADRRFHGVIVGAAANRELTRVLDRIEPRLRRIQKLGGTLPGRRSVAQHEAIIARAAAGDASGAASATRENWLEMGAFMARSLRAQDVSDAS